MNFLRKTNTAKKILVLDLGFLGDTIHLIPALWMIKNSYINSTIDVAVSSNITTLMNCFPWINKTWGYKRYPQQATFYESFSFLKNIRKEKYDVVINLNGSARSSWLTALSGAPKRLGRLTSRGERKISKFFFTDYIKHPFGLEPIFIQRCKCLKKVGFSYINPEFHCEVKPWFFKGTSIDLDDDKYFHISPFTTTEKKELPLDIMVNLLNGLSAKWPCIKIILSCAPIERELCRMDTLLSKLLFKPLRVFKGNLNLVQLVAVIKKSILHFSGDTGTMHIAVMTNTPSISWFQPTESKDWIPQGRRHIVLFGLKGHQELNVYGISAGDILNKAEKIIKQEITYQ